MILCWLGSLITMALVVCAAVKLARDFLLSSIWRDMLLPALFIALGTVLIEYLFKPDGLIVGRQVLVVSGHFTAAGWYSAIYDGALMSVAAGLYWTVNRLVRRRRHASQTP
jgi:positive regulator of sigma E activity